MHHFTQRFAQFKLLLLATILLFCSAAHAQVPPYAKNTGAAGNNTFTWGGGGSSKRVQMLYLPSDFSPAVVNGNITKLYFMTGNTGNTANTDFVNPVIKLGQTTNTAFSPTTTFYTGLTTVWSPATFSIAAAASGTWFEVTLTTPYAYNSAQTLILEVYFDSYTNTNNSTGLGTFTGSTAVTGRKLYTSSLTATTGTATTNIQNLGLEISTLPCTTPPTVGTIASNATGPVCPGSSVNLNITGGSSGSGQTYQWQSAATAAGPFTNLGTAGASPATTVNPVASTYYRAYATCGTASDTSAAIPVSVNPGLSGTFTINAGAPASATNFQSFTSAAAALNCGVTGPVTFNVAAGSGPYVEQITLPVIPGASAINRIRFNGRGQTIRETPLSAQRAIITLDGADYVTFDSLNVVSLSTTYGWGFYLTNGADYNTISNCNIDMSAVTSTTASSSGGIVGSGSATSTTTAGNASFNTITGNTITGAYQGIVLVGQTGAVNSGKNIISANKIKDFYATAVDLTNADSTVIANNDISRAARAAVTTFTGIELGTGCKKTVINANLIHDTHTTATTQTGTAYGIYVNSADAITGEENLITNNAIYNFNSTTGTQYGIYNLGADGVRIYHNTVALTHTASTAGITRGFFQTTTATNIDLRNNIFYITRGGTGIKYCLYFGTTASAITSDYNDLYMNAPAGTNYTGYASAASFATIANWRTAGSGTYDLQSDTLNPLFTALATGNLFPTSTALDNRGTPAGVSRDLPGLIRSTTVPDMGAYEFGVPPCAAPTGLQASGITAVAATLSWTAVTGSTGYEYVTDQAAGNPAGAGTPTTAVSVVSGPLLPLTTYYLHVRNNCGSGSFSAWVTIPFKTACLAPVAGISHTSPLTFCQGDSVVLHTNPAVGLTYQWKNGTADIAGATDSVYTARISGSYSVVVKSDTCATASAAAIVVVNPKPDTTVTMNPASGTVCQGSNVTLSVPVTTGAGYQWYKDGALIPGATSATYMAGTSGDYQVRANTATCSNTSGIHQVLVRTKPVATITYTGPAAFCQGETLLLSEPAPVTGNTYQWQLNTANIAGATASTYNASVIGNYRLIISNGACADTSAPVAITVNPKPVATATAAGPTAFCNGGSVVINANTGTGITYRWLRNNTPITPAATAAAYTATIAGNYRVLVTNATTGCSDTSAAVTITVYTQPAATVTQNGPLTFCQGGSVLLTAAAGTGYTYQWYKDGIAIAGATTIAHTATTSGTYHVVIINGTCTTTTTGRNVVVNPLPAAVITPAGATAFCAGGAVVLSAPAGTGFTYQWQLNGANIAGASSASYTATATGSYTVIVSNGTCNNTAAAIAVTVSTPPIAVITATGAPSFCQGNSVTLQTTAAAGYAYQWHLNGNNITGATAATFTASVSGNYTITVVNGTCTATSAPFAVGVTPAPPAVITPAGPLAFCQGGSVTLNASRGTNYTYQWTKNGTDIPGATNYQYTAVASGDYGVRLSDGICPAVATPVTVTVNTFPAAVITVTGGVNLATGVFNSYQWYRNGVLIPGATGQTYTALRDGFYSVVVTDAAGCSATSAVQQVSALDVSTVGSGYGVVSIWPNPAAGLVNVTAEKAVNIQVASIDGKLLLQADNARSIDISPLAQGIYLIRVYDHRSGALIRTDKLMKKQ